MTFILGLGEFAHCVANSGEILSALLAGNIEFADYGSWLVAATLGNIAGGVVMVSLLNYGQVKLGESDDSKTEFRHRLIRTQCRTKVRFLRCRARNSRSFWE